MDRPQQATRGAAQPPEGGAGEEAAVVGPSRPAVARQREVHDGSAVPAVLPREASRGYGRELQVLMSGRHVSLAGKAEDPAGLVETTRTDDPVRGARVLLRFPDLKVWLIAVSTAPQS